MNTVFRTSDICDKTVEFSHNFDFTQCSASSSSEKKILWMYSVQSKYLLFVYKYEDTTLIELIDELSNVVVHTLTLDFAVKSIQPIMKGKALTEISLFFIPKGEDDSRYYDIAIVKIIENIENPSDMSLLKVAHTIRHSPFKEDIEYVCQRILSINSKLYYLVGYIQFNCFPKHILYPILENEEESDKYIDELNSLFKEGMSMNNFSADSTKNKITKYSDIVEFEFNSISDESTYEYYTYNAIVYENRYIVQYNNMIYIYVFNETKNGKIEYNSHTILLKNSDCHFHLYYLYELDAIILNKTTDEEGNVQHILWIYNIDGTPRNHIYLNEETNKYILVSKYSYSDITETICSGCGNVCASKYEHYYCRGGIYEERIEYIDNMENTERYDNYFVGKNSTTIINCIYYSQNNIIYQICDLLILLNLETGEERIIYDIPDKVYHNGYAEINAFVNNNNIYLCKYWNHWNRNNLSGYKTTESKYVKIYPIIEDRLPLLRIHETINDVDIFNRLRDLLTDPYYIRELASYI